MHNHRKPHSWNAICDVCGFKFKADRLRKRYDGLMVCSQDWEPRHPQELIKVPKENPVVPWARPEAADVFVSITRPLTTETTIDFLLTEGNIVIHTEG